MSGGPRRSVNHEKMLAMRASVEEEELAHFGPPKTARESGGSPRD